jgi:hypothetical protein
MKNFNDSQTRFLQSCRIRAERCREFGAEADRLGLPILAREWDFMAKNLENAIGNQERAFREEALAPPVIRKETHDPVG